MPSTNPKASVNRRRFANEAAPGALCSSYLLHLSRRSSLRKPSSCTNVLELFQAAVSNLVEGILSNFQGSERGWQPSCQCKLAENLNDLLPRYACA
jgi:hypothetical protein